MSVFDAASERYRGRCLDCRKRRMVTDFVISWGVPGIGTTLCDECSVRWINDARRAGGQPVGATQ